MIYLYRLLYFVLKYLLLLLKPFLSDSFKKWLDLRSRKKTFSSQLSNSIWFHASSGEIEYCKSVIRLLKEKKPNVSIVVTYSSPSAEKLFHNITEYVTEFIALPWDSPSDINKLIDHISPQMLIFSRTDFWPELITQVSKRKINMSVISYLPNISVWNVWLIKKLKFISCLDSETADKLKILWPDCSVTADGDTRYDQVFYRLSQPSKLNFNSALLEKNKVLVCGSTWPEDEKILFAAFSDLINQNYKIILSPHETNEKNIDRLINEIQKQAWTYEKLSDFLALKSTSFNSNILIIDKIGYLPDCYRTAHLAFVGGSFKSKVHSVMEPLCCGLPVIVGPHYKNNPEAVKYLGKYVHKVHNFSDFLDRLKQLENTDNKHQKDDLNKNRNASEKILNILLKNL